ncbi:hypothetical protein V9K67_25025 [Paraflavisolibacter sp. H34]|uniref:hypothetical protein n=1 Tax=Huijunlia imazamoxiresistens TaxID=3127457 RepID=UPI003015CE9B
MKKGCCSILFFILLCTTTSFNQVFRLPALVSHYCEHHQLDPNVGFLDFLSMHYWGQDLNDNDQDRDNQLPFKNLYSPTVSLLALPVSKPAVPATCVVLLQRPQPGYRAPDLSPPALAALFRPPRV